MATNPKKRQKKLEHRAAKRKSKQCELARVQAAGLQGQLTVAAKYPVLDCFATTDLWDQGLGWLCLNRALPNGSVAFAVFLIDRYCLGVKNAHADVVGQFTYESKILRKMRASAKLTPATARKFVESAVAYAEGLGFWPHPDYHRAKLLFGTINATESTETFEFGQDGKPYFIAGPNDTPQRCRHIVSTLKNKFGAEGFDFLMPVSPDSPDFPAGALQAFDIADEREHDDGE